MALETTQLEEQGKQTEFEANVCTSWGLFVSSVLISAFHFVDIAVMTMLSATSYTSLSSPLVATLRKVTAGL
jgi:hypothetical protein